MSGDDVAVLGVGMHPWGKWGRTFIEYGVHAARAALADAGVAWTDVDLVVGGETVRNGYGGYVAGATFAQALGWNGARVATSYAACATGAQALDTARARILAGLQRGRAGRRCGHHAQGLPRAQRGRAVGRPGLAAVPAARHDQPGVLRALRAPPDGPLRRDARRTSPQVKVKNARHGLANPNARYRKEVSAEDVLASAVVSDPLHLLDICATSDGAAAVVIASTEYAAARHGLDRPGADQRDLDGHADVPQHRHGHAQPLDRRAAAAVGAGADLQGVDRARGVRGGRHRPRRRRAWPRSTTCRPRSSWTGSRTSRCASAARPSRCCGRATPRSAAGSRSTRRGGLACFGEAVPAQALAQVCEVTWQLRGQADGPPGRGRDGRHHRQPGPLRPRLVGDPQPLRRR